MLFGIEKCKTLSIGKGKLEMRNFTTEDNDTMEAMKEDDIYMSCGRKVMILAMLCKNRQCCFLPLHMAVRLTPAIYSVQLLTCYSCYAIVESI
jgi:hypothetical protein